MKKLEQTDINVRVVCRHCREKSRVEHNVTTKRLREILLDWLEGSAESGGQAVSAYSIKRRFGLLFKDGGGKSQNLDSLSESTPATFHKEVKP